MVRAAFISLRYNKDIGYKCKFYLKRGNMMKSMPVILVLLLLLNVLSPSYIPKNCEEKSVTFRCRLHDRLIFQSLRDAPCRNRDSVKKYWELYSMDENGFNVTRITNNLYWEHQPDISPDGEKIVFAIHYNPAAETTETDPGWEIAVMDVDGTNLTRLTNNDKLDACPHWNHDGTKIVYVSDTYGNLSCLDIYTMDSNGKNVTKLTNASAGEFYADPSFSFSDGESKILYVHCKGYSGNWDIYIMNEDGSDKHCILSADSTYLAYHDPMFSPNDSRIVFSAKLDENGNHGIPVHKIFTAKVDGSSIRQITDNDDESDVLPQYSPDGNKIVYFTWKWNGVGFERKIRVINIDATNERILSTFSPEEMPSWYPRYEKITMVDAGTYDENETEKTRAYIDNELELTDEKTQCPLLWNEMDISPMVISELKNNGCSPVVNLFRFITTIWNVKNRNVSKTNNFI